MSSIFISHSSNDNAWAELIRDWLQGSTNKQHPERRYQSLFLDFDPELGIPVGTSWRDVLYEKLQLCRAVIVICSPAYCESQWCLAELGVAMASGKLVLPVRIEESPELRLLSETQRTPLQPIDLDLNEQDGWQRLERGLAALSWQERLAWPPENEPEASPFPGLSCFERKHAPVFFGQDAVLRQAQAKVEALTASASRLLLILGASGCGKSSLLRAGLVPWLANAESGRWIVLDPFRPGGKPFHWLAAALQKARGTAADPLGADLLQNGPHISDQLEELRAHNGQQDAKVVIAIDQFEELLGRQEGGEEGETTEADVFLAALAELLKLQDSRVLILASLRSDFLGSLQLHPSRLESLAGDPILLGPLDVAGFRQVIEGPAQRVGLQLERGLSDVLVRDTPSGDALPLLAFTLRELWDGRADGADLTLQQYADFGGLAGAVQRKADEVLSTSGATEEETEALERAFIDRLVRLTSDGQVAKQPARLEELSPASHRLVGLFVEARLLVSGKGADGDQVEIAHEALLRTWPKLVGWIEKGREALLQRQRVRRLAEDLSTEAPERQRRQALEQLAALAAAGGSEADAVRREAHQPLVDLLMSAGPLADREDAALVQALIGTEEPLRQCLADSKAPVTLRRRSAESLGLLAHRSGDPEQRRRIADELEDWLRSEALDVRIEVEMVMEIDQVLVDHIKKSVNSYVQRLELAGGLQGLSEDVIARSRQDLIEKELQKVRVLGDSAASPGWKEHDECLPLLQGAARGLQLAASADLPLLGPEPGCVVPMLTLTALEEGSSLRISTKVVEVQVWRLPLPCGEQLELVLVPGGEHGIGSPEGEEDRDFYPQMRMNCEGVNVEAKRRVALRNFVLARYPLSQAQWRAVADLPRLVSELSSSPGTYDAKGLWETHAQPGSLAVDSVSWNDCQEWLQRLNHWLQEHWLDLGGQGEAPLLALPSESYWEVACRAGAATPFHFGDTLDTHWANFNGGITYGLGRKGVYRSRPVPIGFFGLVNRWGLAEMHGQLHEWCADLWQRDPIAGAIGDGKPVESPDPGLEGNREQEYVLQRGGSWLDNPFCARAAFRLSNHPATPNLWVGVRPGCFTLPGLSLGP
ncbi:MAG: SUMF1/EgtB/PvdO family nonheme iron enzyme [Cyanobium sp.]|jgi:formylglycine-generating enzyme required for sulfatase activity/energy-coupling factor transporter ATP-binding protein EcfA2